jgi:hypothetical protein
MSMRPARQASTHTPRSQFRRLMLFTTLAAVLMSAAAGSYLYVMDVLTTVTLLATLSGVFLSVMLGAGLMAMGFLSSNSGHDEWASHFTDDESNHVEH